MSYNSVSSVGPYYDDFDKTKNYLALLFNPGSNVQARELTQIQSVLQNQISSFAGHIFRNDSIVVNSNLSIVSDYSVMTLNSGGDAEAMVANLLADPVITGGTSGAIATITYLDQANYKVYYSSTSGGDFEVGETLTNASKTFTCSAKGKATLASCDSGIIYTSDRFVVVNPQTIVVDHDNTGHYHIGFVKSETVITIAGDGTLGDPAAGFSNETSPGADRYNIDLTLTSWQEGGDGLGTITPISGADTYGLLNTLPTNFVEYMVVEDNAIIKSTDKVEYGEILDLLARRTFDESGDYTVSNFPMLIENHDSDSTKLTLNLQPGLAYVKGYEVDQQDVISLDINKSRDTLIENNGQRLASYGQYVTVGFDDITDTNDAGGKMLDFQAGELVDFFAAGGGAVLSTARVMHASQYGDNIRLYLTEISNSSAISSASVVKSNDTATNYANLKLTNGVAVLEGTATSPIVNFGYDVTKSFEEVETSYYFTKNYEASISGGSITIVPPAGTTFDEVLSVQTVADRFDINDPSVQSWNMQVTLSSIVISRSDGDGRWGEGIAVQVTAKAQKQNFSFRTKTKTIVTERIWIDPADVPADSLYPCTLATAIIGDRITNATNRADGIRVQSVIQQSNTGGPSPLDAAGLKEVFQSGFDSGQRDYFYDYLGFVNLDLPTLRASMNDENDVLGTNYDVTYEYYEHNSNATNKCFGPNSYPAAEFDYIPIYTTENGTHYYDLTNCLDFRLKKEDLGSIGSGLAEFPIPNTKVQSDIEYYLSRMDKVWISTSGDLGVTEGISSLNPELPEDIDGAMVLYILTHQPYTYTRDEVYQEAIDNRRYTMRDIGDIEKRLEAVEEYSALSLLEKSASDMIILDNQGYDKFKSGIFVDSFMSYDTHSTSDVDYRMRIDSTKGHGCTPFTSDFYDMSVGTLTGMVENENTITLAYTETAMATNAQASGSVNVNPFLFYQWNGTVKLSPSIDNWIDTTQAPNIVNNKTSVKIINVPGTTVEVPLPEQEVEAIPSRWIGIRRPTITPIATTGPVSPTIRTGGGGGLRFSRDMLRFK